MAIKKKLIHFKNFTDFNSQKLSANEGNTAYTVGPEGSVMTGEPNILYNSICWIKDTRQMWTHGALYNCADMDLSEYPTESEIAAVYATKASLATVATSGSYNDLTGKPTIPSAVTESTVSGWGFTKNAGTITGITMNGASKGTSGVVDLGTVITAHQDISGKLDKTTAASTYLTKTDAASTYLAKTAKAASATSADSATKATQDASGNVITSTYATKAAVSAKQDKVLKFENVAASSWVSDSTYTDFPFRCDMACTGVTADNFAEVVFSLEQATGGNYAPLCATGTGIVSIWSASDTTITVPTVIITI